MNISSVGSAVRQVMPRPTDERTSAHDVFNPDSGGQGLSALLQPTSKKQSEHSSDKYSSEGKSQVKIVEEIKRLPFRTKATDRNNFHKFEGRIVVYTVLADPACHAVKRLLHERKFPFEEVRLDIFDELVTTVKQQSNNQKTPIVFFNKTLIGGHHDLKKIFDKTGGVEIVLAMLKGKPSGDYPILPRTKAEFVFRRDADRKLSGTEVGMSKVQTPDADQKAKETSDQKRLSLGAYRTSSLTVSFLTELRDAGVLKTHKSCFWEYKNSVIGRDFVDYLVNCMGYDKDGAIIMGQKYISKLTPPRAIRPLMFSETDKIFVLVHGDERTTLNYNPFRAEEEGKSREILMRYQKVLNRMYSTYLTQNAQVIDFDGIKKSQGFHAYKMFSAQLVDVDVVKMTNHEKLAFFINVYNSMLVHAIIDIGMPEGTGKQLKKFFKTTTYCMGGYIFSLHDIKNGVLRGNRRDVGHCYAPFRSSDPRLEVAFHSPEPLVHFALVQKEEGGAPLRIYDSDTVMEQLRFAALTFLDDEKNCVLDKTNRIISLSQMFRTYRKDFGKSDDEMAVFLKDNLPREKQKIIKEIVGDDNRFEIFYMSSEQDLDKLGLGLGV